MDKITYAHCTSSKESIKISNVDTEISLPLSLDDIEELKRAQLTKFKENPEVNNPFVLES